MSDKFDLSRRKTVKLALATAIGTALGCTNSLPIAPNNQLKRSTPLQSAAAHQDNWEQQHNRVWLGDAFWANPMEDWCIKDGKAHCLSEFGARNVHWITHQITAPAAGFMTRATINAHTDKGFLGGAGFRLGVKSEIDDYRSHCFAETGIAVGIDDKGLFIGNKSLPFTLPSPALAATLQLEATKQGQGVLLTLSVFNATTSDTAQAAKKPLVVLTKLEDADALTGNIAIGSNIRIPHQTGVDEAKRTRGGRFSFSQWTVAGHGISYEASRRFGPILWAMYTVNAKPDTDQHDLALTTIMPPVGKDDTQQLELQFKTPNRRDDKWVTQQSATIDPFSYTATFRLSQWNAGQDVPYRVVYRQMNKKNIEEIDYFEGVIKADPHVASSNQNLRMASLTCQNDYAFPYQPVVDNVLRYSPDIVFFSGDQIYEHHGGFGVIRFPARPAMLNYLRKFYQFGWAFRDTMRNCPTVCLPDDHDVLQGNLWGEGGKPMDNLEDDLTASILGGYAEPVKVVNGIHRTCVSHLPAPYDATPTPSGISVYYTTLIYGNVSFAILGDRQWKSAPDSLGIIVGATGQDEAPLDVNPNLDKPGLNLLGPRQEAFLTQWSDNWSGHDMKAVLSQTVFASIATHQQRPSRYLKYDFDSSGWPASARNHAVSIMRKSKALHICGDTHLGTLSQYGVKQQRDANWAFCSPAIAAGWPRWWLPDSLGLPHSHRPQHNHPNTGEYKDAFGNPIYVYAVANPEVGESKNRYIKAHEKGSGFGTVLFNTEAKTFTLCAYQFNVDISENLQESLFPGYPVTLHQDENIGENRLI